MKPSTFFNQRSSIVIIFSLCVAAIGENAKAAETPTILTAHPGEKLRAYNGEGMVIVPEKAASQITFDDRKFSFVEAADFTSKVLGESSAARKIDWLHRIRLFTTNLQQRIVPQLVVSFKNEKDDELRRTILVTLHHAMDPVVVDLCSSVASKDSPGLRVAAGSILIAYRQVEGIEMISNSLDELSPEEQRGARLSFGNAIKLFGFDFKWDKSKLRPDMNSKERSEILTPQWKEWWKKNKAKYLGVKNKK